MKNTLVLSLSLLILTGSGVAGPLLSKAPPARPILPPVAEAGGWYWGLSGGYLWLNDGRSCGCTDLQYDSGWGANGVVGYRFGNGISLGVTAGYLSAKYELIDNDAHYNSGSADLNMIPVMANAAYNLDITDTLLLYVGGGVGTAWSELEGAGSDAKGDWHFAWQGRAGVGVKLNDGVTVNLGYRYVSVADGLSEFGDAKGHMAEAGFKLNF